ncbi:TetR/AcrR family transcriptional regulator [Sinanaerobacter sp. ZZT-01]|uniref:TetR/AcrR family transcriptional regulator n=1 Tax=Sinanaerobacter sp. ZZT-01 TaxID=3111540 RepID=UPI002D78C45C|nr:TetR/AcrR family transcriptional regulator [Sinanaerobacter sp. ZZT-01]WRR94945.1 TetR/AcrR family transcriptional regulator [Sinanaerobacter sp. ZZT-01]
MPGDFEQTHENILNSGKQNFLAYGYERTNLRKLCKDAGITTGAFYRHFSDKEALFTELVEPTVQGIKNIYAASEEECFEFVDKNALTQAFQVSYKVIEDFVHYIYDYFDCFKLLLMCSDGTKYSNFVEEIVQIEVREAEKFFKLLKQNKVKFHELHSEKFHLLTHSYYASVFEVVMHDFTRKEALEYVHTLVTFYNAGWRAVLGI